MPSYCVVLASPVSGHASIKMSVVNYINPFYTCETSKNGIRLFLEAVIEVVTKKLKTIRNEKPERMKSEKDIEQQAYEQLKSLDRSQVFWTFELNYNKWCSGVYTKGDWFDLSNYSTCPATMVLAVVLISSNSDPIVRLAFDSAWKEKVMNGIKDNFK